MKDKILKIVEQTDWTLIKDQDNIKMMQFQNGRRKINIYWGTMTCTFISADGSQEFRNDVDLASLRRYLGIKEKLTLFGKIKKLLNL